MTVQCGVTYYKSTLSIVEKKIIEIREKILAGLTLSHKRLVEAKTRENAKLVFSKNGLIVRIKAKNRLQKNEAFPEK